MDEEDRMESNEMPKEAREVMGAGWKTTPRPHANFRPQLPTQTYPGQPIVADVDEQNKSNGFRKNELAARCYQEMMRPV